MKAVLTCIAVCALLVGCTSAEYSTENPRSGSPTGALLRGELQADEYLGAIKKANEETRANEQFEMNKEPTRAFNTKTQQFEYVPEGTTQKWNEKTQRWEFTPIK